MIWQDSALVDRILYAAVEKMARFEGKGLWDDPDQSHCGIFGKRAGVNSFQAGSQLP
jgi:hypothetical protein